MPRKRREKQLPKKQHSQRLPLHQINDIIELWRDGYSNRSVSTITDISRRCIDKLKNNIVLYGEPYPAHITQGRPSLLTSGQEELVLDYVVGYPTVMHQELAWFIWDEFHIDVDEKWCSRLLIRRNLTRKKAERVALEQNPILRAEFEEKMKGMPADRVCCVDESSSNERTGWRKFGYSLIGTPCKDQGGAKRSKRWSCLPAITTKGYLPHPLVYQGSITAEMFEDWIEFRVLPELDEGMFLVMDNAPIHRTDRMETICRAAGVTLVKLPPYSPNFNPIELSFSSLKSWVRRHIRDADAFETFGHFMEHAIAVLDTKTHAPAWFWSCGYRDADGN